VQCIVYNTKLCTIHQNNHRVWTDRQTCVVVEWWWAGDHTRTLIFTLQARQIRWRRHAAECQLTNALQAMPVGTSWTRIRTHINTQFITGVQGSQSFTDKKSRTFPGLSRTSMKNFPGPFRSPQMFKYKEKTAFTYNIQYTDAMHVECQRRQNSSTFHTVFK